MFNLILDVGHKLVLLHGRLLLNWAPFSMTEFDAMNFDAAASQTVQILVEMYGDF